MSSWKMGFNNLNPEILTLIEIPLNALFLVDTEWWKKDRNLENVRL